MRFVIKKSTARKTRGQFYFHILAKGNHKILAASETYKEKRDAVHAVNLIRINAATAKLNEIILDGTD